MTPGQGVVRRPGRADAGRVTPPRCQECASEAVVVVQTDSADVEAGAEPDRLRCLTCGVLQVDRPRVPAH